MELTVFSVYEVTLHLKQVIESQIEEMYVSGEISNFVHHSSGHMYFNLKDANATMRCTFFKGQNYGLRFRPQDGMQVVCFGKLTVFEKGGSYNLNVKNMSLSGTGNLALQFEQLKQKLLKEGLFENNRKRPLPRHPQRIGIVTSPTAAALQDIRNILERRYPVEVLVYPALVQGNEAPAAIRAGIRYFNGMKNVDLILITRGGGSQEDLFCFNDEALAREIAASELPIVSAVGHEIDFTIADFVADLRAPTPSAAAELIVPDKKDILSHLESMRRRMRLAMDNRINRSTTLVHQSQMSLFRYHPEKVLQSYQQRFDLASMKLQDIHHVIRQKRMIYENSRLRALSLMNRSLINKLHRNSQILTALGTRFDSVFHKRLDGLRKRSEDLELILHQQSPKVILQRGYAIVQKEDRLVSSIKDIKLNDKLKISLKDGDFVANAQI